MKNIIFAVLAVVTISIVSCARHRTCPTYLKNTKEVKTASYKS